MLKDIVINTPEFYISSHCAAFCYYLGPFKFSSIMVSGRNILLWCAVTHLFSGQMWWHTLAVPSLVGAEGRRDEGSQPVWIA